MNVAATHGGRVQGMRRPPRKPGRARRPVFPVIHPCLAHGRGNRLIVPGITESAALSGTDELVGIVVPSPAWRTPTFLVSLHANKPHGREQ